MYIFIKINIFINLCDLYVPNKCFPPDGYQRELPDNVRHHLQSSPQTAARHSHQDWLEQDPQLQDRQRDAKRLEPPRFLFLLFKCGAGSQNTTRRSLSAKSPKNENVKKKKSKNFKRGCDFIHLSVINGLWGVSAVEEV